MLAHQIIKKINKKKGLDALVNSEWVNSYPIR